MSSSSSSSSSSTPVSSAYETFESEGVTSAQTLLLAGNFKDAQKEITNNPSSVLEKDAKGRNVLHYAAFTGAEKIVKLLAKKKLNFNIDLSQPDNFKMTPLHYACLKQHFEIGRLLVKEGARSDSQNTEGKSPLHIVAVHSSLVDPKNQASLLRFLKIWIDDGNGDVNLNDNDGLTALHDAALCGADFLIRFLLTSEGDAHRQTLKRHTPLHYAVQLAVKSPAKISTVKLLLSFGSDPSSLSDDGTCFDMVPASNSELTDLLEEYREKNRRGDSEFEIFSDRLRSAIIVHSPADLADETLVHKSRLLDDRADAVQEHFHIFLYLLSFLTRRIYRTPAQQAAEEAALAEIKDNPTGRNRKAKTHTRAKTSSSSAAGALNHSMSSSSCLESGEGLAKTQLVRTKTIEKFDLKDAAAALIQTGNPRKMFKILDEMGHGAYGTVLRAKEIKWKFHGIKLTKGEYSAVKKIQHTTEKQQWANIDEIYFLSKLEHPNVVRFVSAHLTKHEIWIVMEYLEGGSLQQAVKSTTFKEIHIRYVAKRILQGLDFIHSKGYAHRDLKSANIMLSLEGDVKLIDFGLCADTRVGSLKSMCGSPFWMPPEMIRGDEHSTSCDLWSLGMLCLEMANSIPNRDSALRAMFLVGIGERPWLRAPDKWSAQMLDFLDKLLQVDPFQRPTAGALLAHPFVNSDADNGDAFKRVMSHAFIQKSLEASLQL